MELFDKGEIQKVNVDTTNAEQLIRLLDTIVIKLEGGSEEDVLILCEKPTSVDVNTLKEEEKKMKDVEIEGKTENEEMKVVKKKEEIGSKKRKRTHSHSSSISSGTNASESESESEGNSEILKIKDKEEEMKFDTENGDQSESNNDGSENIKMDKDVTSNIIKTEEEVVIVTEDDDDRKSKNCEEKHKTSSIFIRNLAPTITKVEVEALCKKYEGFLRVAIADPAVERRWFRRGWITFKRNVNIKEICWNLNNIRLRDCELAPIVNRDLSRRVRPVNGITAHKAVCKNDIKICAKIAYGLDEKYGLWKDCSNDDFELKVQAFGLQSKNPVLKNITDYLIEEADAEEEELLGLSNENSAENDGEVIDRDYHLIQVLDKIILYLRIVHSVDFYSE